MFSKPIPMKCGHDADCIMTDVPYHNDKIDIAACSFCFNQFGTAIQPACNINEAQSVPMPKAQKNYGSAIVVAILLFTSILIASVMP